MFLLNIARRLLLQTVTAAPAAFPVATSTVTRRRVPLLPEIPSPSTYHDFAEQDLTPSVDSPQQQQHQQQRLVRNVSSRWLVANPPAGYMGFTSDHMATHDENGPLGTAEETDFLGTIWVRTNTPGA